MQIFNKAQQLLEGTEKHEVTSIGGKKETYYLKNKEMEQPITDEEEARGDAVFWVDELGEKHYS